jgi:hypothetical protein
MMGEDTAVSPCVVPRTFLKPHMVPVPLINPFNNLTPKKPKYVKRKAR